MKAFSEQHMKDGPLVRIDARVKLVVCAALIMLVVSFEGLMFPSAIFLTAMFIVLRLKVPFGTFALRFAEPVFIVLTVMLLKFFFSGTDEIFSVHLFGFKLAGHYDGLLEGLRIAARVMGAVSLVALVGFTTSFTDVMAAMSWFRVPRDFVEILTFAYRFLFVLLDEAWIIYNTQRNRLGYTGFMRGLKSFGTLAGSLIIRVFDQAANTATALSQRGYDGTLPLLEHKPLKKVELIGGSALVTFMVVLWTIM
jgi:cobalt/nickel transport system permease protein